MNLLFQFQKFNNFVWLLVESDKFYNVLSTFNDSTEEECKQKCASDSTCKSIAFNTITKECCFQSPRLYNSFKCGNTILCSILTLSMKSFILVLCSFLKSFLFLGNYEILIKNLNSNLNYIIQLNYETYLGVKGVSYTVYHSSLKDNSCKSQACIACLVLSTICIILLALITVLLVLLIRYNR